MARMAVSDGISVIACTPHILPGVYDNTGPAIRAAVAELQKKLEQARIPLRLTTGADVHLAPDLIEGLREGRVLSLSDSRYLLIEPPQTIIPPRFEDHIFNLVSAGYVPIVTHPERLGWSDRHYDILTRIVGFGCWMQLTGGSLLGHFGRRAEAWAARMLSEGLAHIIASDAHDTRGRPPLLSYAYGAAVEMVGEEEATHLVETRPAGILQDTDPRLLPPPAPKSDKREPVRRYSLRGSRAGG